MMKKLLMPLLCVGAISAHAQNSSIIDSMDKTADPCVNFYQYACGGWIKNNPLPADRARYGTFDQLQERNREILKAALEKVSADDRKRSAEDKKIGDFYAACMDEEAINKAGMKPVQGWLLRIDALKDNTDLGALVSELTLHGVGVFFDYGSTQDFKDASKVIAGVDQGGMGLPSKEDYFKTDEHSKMIREKYVSHISKMLALSGVEKSKSETQAKAILAFETALAEKALTPVERREPKNVYHLKTVSELQSLSPFMNWQRFMDQMGTPATKEINVAVVDFMKNLNSQISNSSLDELKAYLRFRTLSEASDLLSKEFEEENFDFYGRTLQGQKKMRPRWWRCIAKTDTLLGENLGKAFVSAAFSGDSKERTINLIANLRKAYEKDFEKDVPWMGSETKKQAGIKLAAIAEKIGYPEKWRDYSKLVIKRGDFFGNSVRGETFEIQRQLAKIGKPVDKKEWGMTPPTVNAYYDPQMNNINFPAGILQPPFYDKNRDDPLNYGGIGMVIGHEITHGFDDQGRQFDKDGNMRDWWTAKDSKEFDARAQCLVDEYGSFVVIQDKKSGDVKLNGKLTLGENTADNGGIRISWNALRDHTNALKGKEIDGLSPAKRFFLGYGQIWCGVQSEDSMRLQANTNPHSLPEFRVNGAVRNMPEFAEAFSCKAGQPMAPANRCRVW